MEHTYQMHFIKDEFCWATFIALLGIGQRIELNARKITVKDSTKADSKWKLVFSGRKLVSFG